MAGAWQPAVESWRLRQLAWALLASLALHALLLFALPAFREAKQRIPAKVMTARLAEVKPRPPEPLPPRAEPALPAKAPARKPEPRPQPAATIAPSPAPVTVPEPVPHEPVAPAVTAAVVAVPKVDPRPAAAAPATAEAGTLLQYRLEIMDFARRYKRYPRLAADNNWEGRVEVRMVVGASGAIVSLSVKSSTGYEALDQEALAMLRKAKSAATIPPALRGREFTLEVPVIFSLKDEGRG